MPTRFDEDLEANSTKETCTNELELDKNMYNEVNPSNDRSPNRNFQEFNTDHDKGGCDGKTPKIGMIFNSFEDVNEFYKQYAFDTGFGITTRRSHTGGDGRLKYFTLTCARAGKPNCKGKNPFHVKPSTKIDCKARINATLCSEGHFRLSLVVLDHNHAVSPRKSRFYSCNKRLGAQAKRRLELNDQAGIKLSKNFQSLVIEAGGYENLPFGQKECRNYIDKIRRLKVEEGDAEAIRNYFFRMQKKNSNFLYSMDLDGEGRLRNVFWADARSRAAYDSFNDVVTFDTTYLTNRYDMPFAPFVGVNHHGQSILMGCGLISNENTETFVWLFKTWLECMLGHSPKAIITDQCKAIQAAVAEVFPTAKHDLCRWHIMKKVPEKLNGYAEYKAIKSRLKKIVHDSLRVNEFEENWGKMIEEYNLQNNEWLKSLYADRDRWVPVFVKQTFLAGMSSSQRSESMNAFFDDYIHSKTTLKQFVEQYDKALQRKVENENQSDFQSFNSSIPLITALYMEKQMQEIYTHGIFKKFQDEIRDLIYCNASLVKACGSIQTFEVTDNKKMRDTDGKISEQVIYEVWYNVDEMEVRCICRSYEFRGILCRHAISVLLKLNMLEIPYQYILARWRKDIKRPHTLLTCSSDDSSNDDHKYWYDKLCKRLFAIAEIGSFCKDNYELTSKKIDEMEEQLLHSIYGNGKCKLWSSISLAQCSNARVSMNEQCDNDEFLGISQTNNRVLSPLQVSTKGRPRSKRKESKVDQMTNKAKKRVSKKKDREQVDQSDFQAHKRKKVLKKMSNVVNQIDMHPSVSTTVDIVNPSHPSVNGQESTELNWDVYSMQFNSFNQYSYENSFGQSFGYSHLLQQVSNNPANGDTLAADNDGDS